MTDPNQPYGQQPPNPPQGPQPGNQPPQGPQPGYPPPPGQQQPGYPPPPGQQYPGQQQPGYPPAPAFQQGPPQTGPGGLVLHQESGLYIPPGTELASVGRRIGAYFLAIPLFIVTLGIGYIIWGLTLWPKGTSPALKVLGMEVWRIDNHSVPTFGRMALRDFLGRIVDGVLSIITLLVSFIMFVSGEKRQSLHDLVASTTVLYDPNKVLG